MRTAGVYTGRTLLASKKSHFLPFSLFFFPVHTCMALHLAPESKKASTARILTSTNEKPPETTPRQAWSKYRCYLSVLAGFSSHTSGGAPGGKPEYASSSACRQAFYLQSSPRNPARAPNFRGHVDFIRWQRQRISCRSNQGGRIEEKPTPSDCNSSARGADFAHAKRVIH